MKARIYLPAKSAMQSGRGKTAQWTLEYERAREVVEPVMGWVGAGETAHQVTLHFPSKEEAIRYAEKMQLDYEVNEPKPSGHKVKSYAENFRFDKVRA